MLHLVLHASHHYQPEKVSFTVVSASNQLVVDETGFNLLLICMLSLVVSNKNKGWIKASEKLPDDKVGQILMEVKKDGVID